MEILFTTNKTRSFQDIILSVSESGIDECHGTKTNWLVTVINSVGVCEECLELVHCDVTHVCRLISREISSNVPAGPQTAGLPSPPLNQHMTSSPS